MEEEPWFSGSLINWNYEGRTTKGQLISKCLQKNLTLLHTMVPKKRIPLFFCLEETSPWKNHYDFDWPLEKCLLRQKDIFWIRGHTLITLEIKPCGFESRIRDVCSKWPWRLLRCIFLTWRHSLNWCTYKLVCLIQQQKQ